MVVTAALGYSPTFVFGVLGAGFDWTLDVTGIATGVLALATAYLALTTRREARATTAEAEATASQARATGEQVETARKQLERAHRPVIVPCGAPSVSQYELIIRYENVGMGPALAIRVQASFASSQTWRRGGPWSEPVHPALGVGQASSAELALRAGRDAVIDTHSRDPHDPTIALEFEAYFAYEDVAGKRYTTSASWRGAEYANIGLSVVDD